MKTQIDLQNLTDLEKSLLSKLDNVAQLNNLEVYVTKDADGNFNIFGSETDFVICLDLLLISNLLEKETATLTFQEIARCEQVGNKDLFLCLN